MRKLLFAFILFFCIPFTLLAQNKTITGNVVDENDKPLAHVNVSTKSSKKGGVETDADGNFSVIVADQGSVVLKFSYTGYETQTITSTGSENVKIKMKHAVTTQDEVVVIGYQSLKRKDLTGAVSSLGAKQIKDVPVNSATEAITGRIAGVQVTTDEGAPGADATIKVRGGGSITQDNSPLYIIDGVEVENGLSEISPQDIETIDVLKDASAVAIYGARGANGVIIITTKGGKNTNGKTTVNYNGFVGFRELPKELPVMDPFDFVAYQYERDNFTGDSSNFRSAYGTGWDSVLMYKNTPASDWQNKVFGRKALMQTHNVSISGGNQATQYNISLTDNEEEGLQVGSQFSRKLVNFKFDHTANAKLKVGFSARYNQQEVDGAGTSDQGTAAANNLRQVIQYHPLSTVLQQQNPGIIEDINGSNSLFLVNPLALIQSTYKNTPTTVINVSGYANYILSNFLSFKTTAGYDVTNIVQNFYDDSLTYNSILNANQYPVATIDNVTRKILNNSNVFTYSNSKSTGRFKKRNDLDIIAGEETYQTQQSEIQNVIKWFPRGTSPNKALNNLSLASPTLISATTPPAEPATITNPNPQDNPVNQLSYFSRVNYTYDKKYLLTLTFRADGTTIFSPQNRWGYFPAASAAWRISDEDFMQKVHFLSDLKLRASYGTAGNNRINPFSTVPQFGLNAPNAVGNTSPVGYGFNNQFVSGFAPTQLVNSDLKWETTVSKNIGLDVNFFKNKLQLTADIYQNDTKDLLVDIAVPSSSGYELQYQNVGSTRNKGLELQLQANIIQAKNFSWSATFNISFNKNKVVALGKGLDSFLVNSGWEGNFDDYKVQVGQSLGQIYGLVNDGWYTTNDFTVTAAPGGSPLPYVYTLKQGVVTNTISSTPIMPGAPKYKDLNGDGIISTSDYKVIGNTTPKFFGGLNQQFTYKNGLDLSVFINFQYGNNILNANKVQFSSGYTYDANMLALMENRWKTIDNNGNQIEVGPQNSRYSSVIYAVSPDSLNSFNKNAKVWMPSTNYSYFVPQSFAVENGSFIRINNITMGYTFPAKLVKKIHVARLRIYGTVNNLAVISNYSGYDPEVNVRHSSPLTPGVDYSAYPRSRSYIVGVNLSL